MCSSLLNSVYQRHLRNPVIPTVAAASSASLRRHIDLQETLRRFPQPPSRQAQASRPLREPSRVFENMSRSLSNARQAVSGFFARVMAPTPHQPAMLPAPASVACPSVVLSSAPVQSVVSPVSPASLSIVASPLAIESPVPATPISRPSSSCLPFRSVSSGAAADSTSLLAGDSDLALALEPSNDQAAAQGRRPSLWRSFSGLWRSKSERFEKRLLSGRTAAIVLLTRCAEEGRIRI
jgi:hypothetical protein